MDGDLEARASIKVFRNWTKFSGTRGQSTKWAGKELKLRRWQESEFEGPWNLLQLPLSHPKEKKEVLWAFKMNIKGKQTRGRKRKERVGSVSVCQSTEYIPAVLYFLCITKCLFKKKCSVQKVDWKLWFLLPLSHPKGEKSNFKM